MDCIKRYNAKVRANLKSRIGLKQGLKKQLKQILLEQPFWPLVEEIQAQIAEIVVCYDPEYAGTMALKVAPFYVLPTQTFLRVEVLDQTAARRLHPNLTIPWRVMDLYLTMSGRSDNLNRLCVEAAAQKLRQAFQRQNQLLCDFGLRGGSDFG